MVVVLPAPLHPMKPKTAPRFTDKSRAFRARTEPKAFETPRASIANSSTCELPPCPASGEPRCRVEEDLESGEEPLGRRGIGAQMGEEHIARPGHREVRRGGDVAQVEDGEERRN